MLLLVVMIVMCVLWLEWLRELLLTRQTKIVCHLSLKKCYELGMTVLFLFLCRTRDWTQAPYCWPVYPALFACVVFLCTCSYICAHMYKCACGDQKLTLGAFLNYSTLYAFKARPLVNLEMANQPDSGNLLSLPPQLWAYKHRLPYPALDVVDGKQNSGLHNCTASTLLTGHHSTSRQTLF